MSNSKLGNTNASGNKGYLHINKDGNEMKVKPEELEGYLSDGWKKGHKPYSDEFLEKKRERYKNSTYINRDGVVKHILNSDLQIYTD